MQNQRRLFDDEEMLRLMRDRFLVGLVSGGSPCKHLQEALAYLELNPFFTFPVVALVELAASYPDDRAKQAAVQILRHYLERHVAEGSAVFLDGEDRIGVLFSWVHKDWIAVMGEQLHNELDIAVDIGVGKPCGQLADIHQSYGQAKQALEGNFYKATGEVVYYSQLTKYQRLDAYPMEQEIQMFENLKYAEHAGQVAQIVEQFYSLCLQNGPVAPQSICELTIRLLIGLEQRTAYEIEKVSVIIKRCEIMSVVHMKSIHEVKIFVCKHLTLLREIMLQHEQENHRSIIKKTIQYMEQECQHATLYSVAQKVYMTPTYLSSLFKLNTGKTFIDQLTDIRISKAKDMLKSTHLKNYEVAEKVGYKDSRYFSQIFKKKVGLSPSEYRETGGVR